MFNPNSNIPIGSASDVLEDIIIGSPIANATHGTTGGVGHHHNQQQHVQHAAATSYFHVPVGAAGGMSDEGHSGGGGTNRQSPSILRSPAAGHNHQHTSTPPRPDHFASMMTSFQQHASHEGGTSGGTASAVTQRFSSSGDSAAANGTAPQRGGRGGGSGSGGEGVARVGLMGMSGHSSHSAVGAGGRSHHVSSSHPSHRESSGAPATDTVMHTTTIVASMPHAIVSRSDMVSAFKSASSYAFGGSGGAANDTAQSPLQRRSNNAKSNNNNNRNSSSVRSFHGSPLGAPVTTLYSVADGGREESNTYIQHYSEEVNNQSFMSNGAGGGRGLGAAVHQQHPLTTMQSFTTNNNNSIVTRGSLNRTAVGAGGIATMHSFTTINSPSKGGAVGAAAGGLQSTSTNRRPVGMADTMEASRRSAATTAVTGVTKSHTVGSSTIGKSKLALEAVKQAALKGTNSQSKGRYTFPLSFLLFGQCSLVILAFICIVVVADVMANQTAEELILNGVTTELKYAGTQIDGPINSIETSVLEFRNRYLSYFNYQKREEPCSQTVGGFTASSGFYADAVMAIGANPLLSSVFYVRKSSLIDNTTNQRVLNQCSASPIAIFKRHMGHSIRSMYPPSITDFDDLDLHLPRDPIATTRQQTQIDAALQQKRVTWIPLSVVDANDEYILMLIAAAPVRYNITDLTIDPNVTGAFDESIIYYNISADRLTDSYAAVNPHLYVRPISVLAMTIKMADYPKIMRSVTPMSAGAHTSLYDMNTGKMLATSVYSEREQLNYITGELFTAGATATASLNDAYHTANPSTLVAGEIRVHFGSDRVTSSYLYTTAASGTGIQFAVVQSTPREHYFGLMQRLRMIMIVLGVVCALLVVAACLLVGISVYVGGRAIIVNMGYAAGMKYERTVHVSSLLREIQQLSDGFDMMNSKLLEAKAYLPQHLLVSSSDEDADDEEVDEGAYNDDDDEGGGGGLSRGSRSLRAADRMTATSNGQQQLQSKGKHQYSALPGGQEAVASPSQQMSPSRAGTMTTATTNSRDAMQIEMANLNGMATAANGVLLKRVTILSLNMRGFHSHSVNATAPSTVSDPVGMLTQLVSELALQHKGVIDAFHGDHFVVSFNAAKSNAEGPMKAARCAMELAKSREVSNANGKSGGTSSGSQYFSMGISTGKACVGHMGSATLKRLSIIGPVYSKAMALERLCKRFNPSYADDASALDDGCFDDHVLPIQCLVDAAVSSEIQHSFLLQVLGGLYGSPYHQYTAPSAGAVLAPSSSAALLQGQLASAEQPLFGMETLLKPNNRQPNARGGRGGGLPPPLEVFYALRSATTQSKGDEWLYELQNSSNSANKLTEVNRAVLQYLHAVHDAYTSAGGAAFASSARRASVAVATHQLPTTKPQLLQQMCQPSATVFMAKEDENLFGELQRFVHRSRLAASAAFNASHLQNPQHQPSTLIAAELAATLIKIKQAAEEADQRNHQMRKAGGGGAADGEFANDGANFFNTLGTDDRVFWAAIMYGLRLAGVDAHHAEEEDEGDDGPAERDTGESFGVEEAAATKSTTASPEVDVVPRGFFSF